MGNTNLDRILEPNMTDETTDKKSALKASKPKRATLVHPNMKGEAKPFEKDAAAWLAKGWKRKAGNAE